jgi:uncharacterized SAM-binding protein YcdF (DUF218 family)
MRKRNVILALLLYLCLMGVNSIPKVRSILARPLIVSDEDARGDACYVLADGAALWDRLEAAAAIYHLGRTRKIILMKNSERYGFNFTAESSWTQTQWALDFLKWRGVARSDIVLIEEALGGTLGTLTEARHVASSLPPGLKRLVLVSSAPHLRRCMLAFRRVLPRNIALVPYAASYETSSEIFNPLWIEYTKLCIYAVIAW